VRPTTGPTVATDPDADRRFVPVWSGPKSTGGLAESNLGWYDAPAVRFQGFPICCPYVPETIMPDKPTPELIENLRQAVRRWKALALTLLAGLGLVIVLGMTATAIQVQRARQAAEAERDAALEAQRAVEQFLQKDLLDQRPIDHAEDK
jgi:hypothetical protein